MSQKLIGSLTRPIKVELALGPVASGLEQGAELAREAPFGAPRMFGGQVGDQSKLADAGHVHVAIACFAAVAAITDLRISSGSHDAGSALGSRWNRLQLDGWITYLRSINYFAPESAPCRMHALC